MSAMNVREMPVVTARWENSRWVIALPGGPREAADDREAVELIARLAPYSAVKWILPSLGDFTSPLPAAGTPSAGSGQPEPA